MDLETILKDMLSGVDPPPDDDTKSSLRAAMKAYSVKQLDKMNQAGVRFWPFIHGAPPEYEQENVTVDDLKAPADYMYLIRLFRISPATLKKGGVSATDILRHELAHAWDNVRGREMKNIRKLKGKALTDEVARVAQEKVPFASQLTDKLPPSNLSMQEMLDKYVKVLRVDKDMSFAHPSTASKHLAANVMEFYAEGYSVFHGHTDDRQSRLLRLATELYDYLEKESKTYGLPVPNRSDLSDLFNKTYPDWKNF